MGKIAFIFAGQGAQKVGMGKDISEFSKKANDVFEMATEALSFDIKKMIFEGDEETLKITENTQPTVLTVDVACYEALIEKGVKPDFVCGLSLGEYAANVASGTMSFSDAVKTVKKRGKYMQEAVPLGVGTMAAIMGLSNEAVLDCCSEASEVGIVEAANFNCPGQVVIAGEVAAVEKACEIAKSKGAKRAMLLPVSAPFHCSMLIPAGEKLKEVLNGIEMSDFKVPLVSNVTAKAVNDKSEIKDLLIKQVSSPVYFEACISYMIENGVDTFIEIGPGKTLSGFVKKINSEVSVLNVEDVASLNATLQALNIG